MIESLPTPISEFLDATAATDWEALASTFRHDGVLNDWGETYRGTAAMKEWSDRIYFGANVTLQPVRLHQRGEETILTVMVDGDYKQFDIHEPFELDYVFRLDGDKIAELTMFETPHAVQRFVKAMNAFDLEAMLAEFHPDALVNDQLREFWGVDAIRRWATKEIVGDHVTLAVQDTRHNHGLVSLTGKGDGDYDKTGLPDPLVLTFYFALADEKFAQLIILTNKPGY